MSDLFSGVTANITLRDYQNGATDAIFREWLTRRSTLLVMATGLGKTTVFSEVVKRAQPCRVMVLAHRNELVDQAYRRISAQTGLSCGIEMADLSTSLLDYDPQVVVSTIQTQTAGKGGGRMNKFNPMDFGLLIVDESHHAPAASFLRCIEYYKQNPALKILGVTATPDRADKVAMGNVFESVAFDHGILAGIDGGWLVPVNQQMIHVHGLDFSKVKTTAGDLNGGELAEIMEYESVLHGVADPTMQIIGNRKTLVFAASVKHAERLCEIFNRHREGCAGWVCGETEKNERKKTLHAFKHGGLQIVVNVGVLTEGFDAPCCEVIAMARPTKSRSLYTQCVGRALRPLEGVVDGHEKDTPEQRCAAILISPKPSALILDFVGNSGRHKLMTTADILGGNFPEEAIERARKKAAKSDDPVDMARAIEKSAQDIVDEREKAMAAAEARRLAEEARRAAVKAQATYTTTQVNPFDAYDIQPRQDRPSDRGRKLSDKQAAILEKQGIDPSSMNYASAKALLDETFRRWNGKLCTLKQAAKLKSFGYADAHNFTMEQAGAAFDALKKNNWKKVAT